MPPLLDGARPRAQPHCTRPARSTGGDARPPIATYLNAQPGPGGAGETLDEPEHGLTEAALGHHRRLIWWGHAAHNDVKDAVVEHVQARVLAGIRLSVLHSAHYSKSFGG